MNSLVGGRVWGTPDLKAGVSSLDAVDECTTKRAKHNFFIFPYRSAGALYLLGYGYSSFSLHPNAGFGKLFINLLVSHLLSCAMLFYRFNTELMKNFFLSTSPAENYFSTGFANSCC